MFKHTLFFLSSLILSAVGFAASSPEASLSSENGILLNQIVALVNEGVVTQTQVDTRVNLEKMQATVANISLPDTLSLEQQSLERLITQTVALQLAARNQITVSDQAVTEAMNQISARTSSSQEDFALNLKKFNLTEANYRELIKDQLILRALAEKAIAANIIVSPDEVNAYIAQQKQTGTEQELYHVAHILIALPANPSPEDLQKAKAKADQVATAIQQGLDFSTAAMKYSASEDATSGGDLGEEPLNQLPTLFIGPVKNLKPGEVSPPFISPSGYHLLKLISVHTSPPVQHFVTQYQIKQIIIHTSPVISDSQAETMLDHLRMALENGKSFDVLARENSQDPLSASKGGLVDFASLNDLGPEDAAVIQELKPGEISQPFRISGGWALIQLLQSRQYNDTADFAKKEAMNVIFQKKAMDAMETWEAQLRGESYIKILVPRLNPGMTDAL